MNMSRFDGAFLSSWEFMAGTGHLNSIKSVGKIGHIDDNWRDPNSICDDVAGNMTPEELEMVRTGALFSCESIPHCKCFCIRLVYACVLEIVCNELLRSGGAG